MISGASKIRKDVPPFTRAARDPLAYIGINAIGLRRRNFSNEKINEIQEIYRLLFMKGFSVKKAVEQIETEITASAERDEILNFVKNSPRGLMKGYSGDEEEE